MYFEGDKTSDDTIGIHRMTLSKMVKQCGYHAGTDSLDKPCKFFACNVQNIAEYIEDVAD